MYVRDSLTFGAPEWELTRGYDLVHDESMQLPPLHLSHDGRETMRKLLLTTAAAIMLAGPALAEQRMLTATLNGSIKAGPFGSSSTIVPGPNAIQVAFIAIGNRVDVYVVGPSGFTPVLIPALTVTVPLGTIVDMVFTPNPAPRLTVQGGGPFAVTIDYGTTPPTVLPPVAL
jgi:hypothetical protein